MLLNISPPFHRFSFPIKIPDYCSSGRSEFSVNVLEIIYPMKLQPTEVEKKAQCNDQTHKRLHLCQWYKLLFVRPISDKNAEFFFFFLNSLEMAGNDAGCL